MYANTAGSVALEHDAVRAARLGLAEKAGLLDASGDDLLVGDCGEASALVASLVGVCTEVASRLVVDGFLLDLGIQVASGDLTATDGRQAVTYLEAANRA